ncbi:hypothetical protein IAU60_005581 [Kwoniella sp. DSM 27419]
MPDSLEAAALNGSLFTFDPTPSSPTRSAETISPRASDDEDGDQDDPYDLEGPGPRGSRVGRHARATRGDRQQATRTIEHEGPQTGPKGVIEDRRAADTHARAERDRAVAEQAVELNRRAIVGLTVHEEDELRRGEKEEGEGEDQGVMEWRRRRRAELAAGAGRYRDEDGESDGGDDGERSRRDTEGHPYPRVKRGGLRELGVEGYVAAVEQPGWVVVLIYETGIPRCTSLLASLLHLSLNMPSTPTSVHLYRALASSLSFSLLPPTSQTHAQPEPYYDDDSDGEEQQPSGRPDPDVLPTMLVYKDGELEKNWVRVDWDIAEDGVEGLLRREGVLPPVHKLGTNRQHLLDLEDE